MAQTSGVVVWAYLGLPVVATVLHAVLGYWIYRDHWDERGSRWFVVMVALGGTYALFTSVQLFVPWRGAKALLSTAGGFFGLTSYVAFAAFAGEYTETQYHRRPVVKLVLATIPVGYVLVSLLRPFANVWVTDIWIETEPFRYLAYEPGPGLLFLMLLSYGVGFYNLYKLLVYLLSTSKRATKQIALLMAGTLSIMLVAAASNLGLFPAERLYHGVYATIPFILFTSLAIFRFDFLRVQPVARNAVVEALDDPVVVLDDDHAVADFNESSTRLWPDLPDAAGDPFADACPALAREIGLDTGDWDDVAADVADGAATQISLSVDGTDRHFSVSLSAVGGADGENADWVSILLRDVTALEQSRWQLEKQNERLDQVASTISHDLRNPINVAMGHVEILDGMIGDDGLDADQVERARESLAQTEATHERMLDIIEDILTIAREGKTVDETEPVGLGAVAREAWGNVDTGAATLTVADDGTVQADRSKLLTVFENCFRNSVDHGPDDVAVEVARTRDGFAVQDDGPGVGDAHVDDIFEYGYTDSEDGTGLGLSIVRTMAESHGWTVEYDRAFDDGARFVFGGVDVVQATPGNGGPR